MTGPAARGSDVVLRTLAAAAETPGAAGILEGALDGLVAALGARAAAFYAEEPGGGGLTLRCRRPEGGGPAPEDVMVPARLRGQPAGAVGLSLEPGASLDDEGRALTRSVAQALALAVRNDDLVRGLGDRVRELDRQARQLEALTRVARRVAQTLDEDDARRVVVSEARDLLVADAAVLLVGRRRRHVGRRGGRDSGARLPRPLRPGGGARRRRCATHRSRGGRRPPPGPGRGRVRRPSSR